MGLILGHSPCPLRPALSPGSEHSSPKLLPTVNVKPPWAWPGGGQDWEHSPPPDIGTCPDPLCYPLQGWLTRPSAQQPGGAQHVSTEGERKPRERKGHVDVTQHNVIQVVLTSSGLCALRQGPQGMVYCPPLILNLLGSGRLYPRLKEWEAGRGERDRDLHVFVASFPGFSCTQNHSNLSAKISRRSISAGLEGQLRFQLKEPNKP